MSQVASTTSPKATRYQAKGTKPRVPAAAWPRSQRKAAEAATKAAAILVPVETEGQISVVVVTPDAPGVSIEPQQLSDGELAGRISITDPSALPTLGGADVAVWLDEHLRVAITAYRLATVQR